MDSLDRYFPVKESRPDLASSGWDLWTVTSLERNVDLTTPQIDRLFGPSVTGEGKSGWPNLRWNASLDHHGLAPASDELTHSTVSSLWGMSAWPTVNEWTLLDSHFPGKESRPELAGDGLPLWTVTSWGGMPAWLRPEMDWLFWLSLPCEGKSAWLRLRWIDSLDSHFAGKESQPDHDLDRTSVWTVTSQERKVSLTTPRMKRLIGPCLPKEGYRPEHLRWMDSACVHELLHLLCKKFVKLRQTT